MQSYQWGRRRAVCIYLAYKVNIVFSRQTHNSSENIINLKRRRRNNWNEEEETIGMKKSRQNAKKERQNILQMEQSLLLHNTIIEVLKTIIVTKFLFHMKEN